MQAARRAWFPLLLLVLLSAVAGVGWARAQAGDPAAHEAAFTDRIASERSSRDLRDLLTAPDLVEVARRHSARMAERGSVYHNPALGEEVEGWEVVGENVGVGDDVAQIHDAFMASQVHRDEILYPTYTQVGVGVVHAHGKVWVTQVFRQPMAGWSPTTTAPPSEPASEASAAPVSAAAASGPDAAASPSDESVDAEPRPATRAGDPSPVAPPTIAEPPPTIESPAATDLPQPATTAVPSSANAGGVAVEVAVDVRDVVDEIPTPAAVAAALLCLVVGAQCVVVRHLGLA